MAEINSAAEIMVGRVEEGDIQDIQIAPSSSQHNDGDESLTHLDQHWVSSVKEGLLIEPTSLKVSLNSISCATHRVLYRLPRHHKNAFDPQVISIGPFHYEERKRPTQSHGRALMEVS